MIAHSTKCHEVGEPWYSAPEFVQFPIVWRIWVLWCAKGLKWRDGGSAGGNFLFRWVSEYYRRYPYGHDNLIGINFNQAGLEVFVDLLDKETFQHSVPILSNGSAEIKLLETLLEEGDGFVDIGANIGTLSLPGAKRVGQKGQVIAIEPSPRVAEALLLSVLQNGMSQIDVIQAAAADEEGMEEFYLSDASSGVASFFPGHVSRVAAPRQYNVKVIPLDSLIHTIKIKTVRLIKIDVEGAELRVISGAQRFIERFTPFICCEFNPLSLRAAGRHYLELFGSLRALGYRKFYDVASLVDGSLIEVEKVSQLINVLAVHQARELEFNERFKV
jgi:FkbM family methyltransferase